ncbi:MAG: hypothetical protein ABIJ65_04315 [Chloroflexota bacterium]
MKTICFHHNDPDGRASGAIVRYALGKEILLHEVDYDGRPIPWSEVETAQHIVVVDFSFPRQDMLRLATGRELTWIDHHKTAITEYQDIAQDWKGLRDTTEAACVLVWKYYFPKRPVPRAVILVGDRDIWRWAEAETGDFNDGLYRVKHESNQDELWVPLFEGDAGLLEEITKKGHAIRDFHLKDIQKAVQRRGFEVEFEGSRTLVINKPGNGDIGQYSRDLGYEMAYCYFDQMQAGRLITSVTLFSGQVDVSKIAQRFGGGGHAGAAGFDFPRNDTPFPADADVKWKQVMPKSRR